MGTTQQLAWTEQSEDPVFQVGPHARVQTVGDVRVLFVAGMPVLRVSRQDPVALRAYLAALVEADVVRQSLVSRSGLVTEATFHRDCKAFRDGGLGAVLSRAERGSKGPRKVTVSVVAEVESLRAAGLTYVAIGTLLGISDAAARLALKGRDPLGVREPQLPLLHDSALPSEAGVAATAGPMAPKGVERPEPAASLPSVEVAPPSASPSGQTPVAQMSSESAAPGAGEPIGPIAPTDTEEDSAEVAAVHQAVCTGSLLEQDSECARQIAMQRQMEWLWGRLGLIEEQSALFPPVARTKYAGTLLALALLSVTGLLEEVRRHLGKLSNGLYGVRSVVTTLIVMAMLRCKRPEQLKGFDPTELGAVLGLCRAPEMKTLRRKLKALSQDENQVVALVRARALRHAARHQEAMAFLYIDGHVRPYFGDKKLGKAHHTGMRIALPATTDYWVCDDKGAPVLVVITEGNKAMTKVIESLLQEVRQVVGPDVRPTVVFDRGGYSPKLFARLVKAGFDFITYRKGIYRKFPKSRFKPVAVRRAGRDVPTPVYDVQVRLKGYGLVRCVAVLRDDGGQTQVLTSRRDLSAAQVLFRMFSRWQQENLFKYLRESYALDALWTYQTVEADPDRLVPNPQRTALDKQITQLRALRQKQASLLGQLVHQSHPLDPSQRADELDAQRTAAARLAPLDQQIAALKTQRKALPKKVTLASVRESKDLLELARAPMLLTDVIKMTAFHLESMLLTALAPHLKRADQEGRACIADLMHLEGRLEPQADHLRVTLSRPSAPRYVRALEALCGHLNQMTPCFPETSLRLRFQVAPLPN